MMPSALGMLRQWVLAPSLHRVSFAGRGFPAAGSETAERLEAIPQAVVCGFEWAIAGATIPDLHRRLRLVDAEHRGFAYEGATMACTVLDSVRGQRTRELLTGPGERHILLAYIGIGFAMARLPRSLWQRALPDLSHSRYHPRMSWLAVDGYGFDLAYFDRERWIDRQQIPTGYPWDGRPEYFPRAMDQGFGRALWFVHGGDCRSVAAAVHRFAPPRQADLWSGVGLAATFAGAADPAALTLLAELAGEHRTELAIGSVFAVKARTDAGYLPPHTGDCALVLTGRSVAELTELADRTEWPDGLEASDEPEFEQWRQRIRRDLAVASPGTAPGVNFDRS
jgi:enediyne biosynthesis protein E2